MSRESWEGCILLLMALLANASGSFIGINIGTEISNLPSTSNIISILKTQDIKHVRLLDADHQMLTALANTGIEVMVSVPNDQLLKVGESRSEAADWINKNIAPYLPATNITYIAVGNEVLTTIPNAALVLVPAMQFLQSALLAANLNTQVKVSSPQSMDMIPKSFPPSTAAFNSTWNSVMYQFLQFLKNTGSSFMLNAQPYYGYTKGNGIFPLEYALFRSLTPNSQIVDPNTLFYYTNMFDAMVDAAYYSMQALNFSAIPVLVTASGWPSLGGANEPDATIDNALVYNSNLVNHVLNGSGTPSQPSIPINTYLYELFNEDLRPGPISEKNWGIYNPNGTAVYTLNYGSVNEISDNVTVPSGLVGIFCVANSSADSTALKEGLDWACGSGSANCSAIQPGQPCYESDNLVATASYAFNDYYHRTQANGGTCNFGDTAMITSVDPSHDSCIFAGSSGSNGTASSGNIASGPMGPVNDGSRSRLLESSHVYTVPVVLIFWFAL
ncbi:glucan endo-1,3-beta-glucosidase 4 isoform X1 [Iris pallida]|uniref:glucan endo-1,3-beta-D-glucosidase n=1 Tax=Iris pallida TaxID=29817 RepID=A0AAX6DUC2_IRIPA|nr:glucan endo-1,3-beta-glucosidase 4 isoform X1 [Iris pallida]